MQGIKLSEFNPDPALKRWISRDLALKHRCIGVVQTPDALVVAFAMPFRPGDVQAIERSVSLRVDVVVAPFDDIQAAIEVVYGELQMTDETMQQVARVLARFELLADAPPAEFRNTTDEETGIAIGAQGWKLKTRRHGFALETRSATLDFTYEAHAATMRVLRSATQVMSLRWDYSDPAKHAISLERAGGTFNAFAPSERLLLGIGQVVKQSGIVMQDEEVTAFGLRLMFDSDFKREFVRRVGARLPDTYFDDLSRARTWKPRPFMAHFGCMQACFMASLLIETGAADLAFWGMCLICNASGVWA